MAVSKRFGYYRKRIGVEDRAEGKRRSLVNFHSWRRWFATKAEQAGQPMHIIDAVGGWVRPGMAAGRYSAGPSPEQRRACVEAVRLPALPEGATVAPPPVRGRRPHGAAAKKPEKVSGRRVRSPRAAMGESQSSPTK
mgnify:FL=1